MRGEAVRSGGADEVVDADATWKSSEKEEAES